MFKRDQKPSWAARIQDIFWPSIGWRRWSHYVRHRIGRLQGSPGAIAAGFAFGAAVSFTPFIGFHILLGVALAFLTRSSIVAAAIGTVVGNPWTFPFIWIAIYNIGTWIIGAPDGNLAAEGLSIGYLIDHFWDVFIPMSIGAVPLTISVWCVFYFVLKPIIARYQSARLKRRQKKILQREALIAKAEPMENDGLDKVVP